MKRHFLFILMLLLAIHVVAKSEQDVVPVILTAGQSNADGRVPLSDLPDELKTYPYCMWSYGSGDFETATGEFTPFSPRVAKPNVKESWGFDAVVYHELENLWKRPFYVIKQTDGGTAIDTACKSSTHGLFWSADPAFLSNTTSASHGGKSLLKAFTRQIDDCLPHLPANYDIKVLIWHQGESDQAADARYYENMKAVVQYVRQHLVQKTGRKRYAQLPVVCGTYAMNSRMRSQKVVDALGRLEKEDPNFHVVDASDLTLQRDRLHFDAQGAQELGRRVFDKLKKMMLPPAKVSLEQLTVEGRKSPMGLDVENPRCGWVIVSSEQNVLQTSYHLQVATSRKEQTDVWDSGIVHSDQSQWVPMSLRLKPSTTYYWRVKVTTNKGETAWSDWSQWTTGRLSETNWKGLWIGYDSLTSDVVMERHSRIAARHLKKEYALSHDARVKRAVAHVCGLGYYLLSINGQRIGEYLLAPAPTQYDKAVCYDTYDVTRQVVNSSASTGKIEVVLGGGYFFPMTQNYQTNVRSAYGMPKMRMDILVEYEDGTEEVIATDSTWKVATDGPIRYANLYDGTLVDYRCVPTEWMPVQMVDAPCAEMRGNALGGVKSYAIEPGQRLIETGDKKYIIDFGTNNTGRIYLPSVLIGNGDTICVRYAETLQDNGQQLYVTNLRGAQNTDYFVGNGKQVDLTTEFLWHGFRYMEVVGLSKGDVQRITRQLMTDDLISTSTIDIDEGDGMLNKILSNARRGILSNYKGIPMDCPQRDERMPWLGDRTMGCYGESYLTHNQTLYAKWMNDICDAQQPNGNISDVCPAYWRLYNGNITWPAALPFGMEMLRLQYGDERPLHVHYENVKRFLAYAKKKSGRDGLITYDRYGDWCVPPATLDEVVTKDSTRMTDGALLSSTYYYYICQLMERYARQQQKEEDARFFAQEAAETQEAVNRHFLHDGCYANGTVTANLLPLVMGIVPEREREVVLQNFMKRVRGMSGEAHIDCGVIGISWLMRYLSNVGFGKVAYQIASAKTYPGWGYMVENGATTIWELWNGNTANPSMNSGNHVMMLGDLIPWAYECLAGIAPDSEMPGFKHVIMHPDFSVEAIRGVSAAYPSLYGQIVSDWKRVGSHIEWMVTIPANTTATLCLPNGKVKKVGSGTYHIKAKLPHSSKSIK